MIAQVYNEACSFIRAAWSILEKPVEVPKVVQTHGRRSLHFEQGKHPPWRLGNDIDLTGSVTPVVKFPTLLQERQRFLKFAKDIAF